MGRGILRLTPEQESEVERLWARSLYSATETARVLECSVNTVLRTIKRRGFERSEGFKRCTRCRHIYDTTKVRFNGGRCSSCLRYVRIQATYGLSEQDWEALMRKQNLRCAICENYEQTDENGRSIPFHVDHCHETNRVRGLLCLNCNTGLGKFKHDPKLLRSAVAYL